MLWCGGLGLDECRAQIQRDNMPVIAVFNDLWSTDSLFPKGKERSIFQIALPDKMTFQTILDYAKNDRGYSKVGLMYDSLLGTQAKGYFESRHQGARASAPPASRRYQLSDADFGPQVRRLKDAKSQALFVWGIAGDTAGIAKAIDKVGGGYVDTPTAKGGGWAPHIMGSPAGTGEHTWADLAGSAAKIGTITAWHVGGLVSLPSFAIRGWMQKYLKKSVTGGEESPADGLFTLMKGVEKAGSTDRQKVVSAIETMGDIQFASLPFGFSASNHLSKTEDDLIVVTLEKFERPRRRPNLRTPLGQEWKAVFPPATSARPTSCGRPSKPTSASTPTSWRKCSRAVGAPSAPSTPTVHSAKSARSTRGVT